MKLGRGLLLTALALTGLLVWISAGGQAVIPLGGAAQAREGILTTKLQAGSRVREIRAYGTVLELRPLVNLHASYAEARSGAEAARASLEVSRREYERLRALRQKEQNISLKALEAARAAFRSDRARARAAAARVRAVGTTAREEWGPVVGRWAVEGSAAFDRLLDRRDVLIQVTLPPDVSISARSPRAYVVARDGTRVSTRFISPAAHTASRIQGITFFYVASAESCLLPGMNVVAFLAAGSEAIGAAVPESAVVRWQGKAWVYVQTGPGSFVRREIRTDMPADGGGYLVRDLAVGIRVVVQGAQLLLSEEFRAEIEVSGEQER